MDKNPLAVDLCRVALWLESHAADKPLTFLDHRIRCGDSLVGVFDLAVLKEGIPDKAFDPLEGDDKAYCPRAGPPQSRGARGDRRFLTSEESRRTTQDLRARAARSTPSPMIRPKRSAARKSTYQRGRADPEWQRQKKACDLWTGAFFQPLRPDQPGITSARSRRTAYGYTIDGRLSGDRSRFLATVQRFFHWPLEFPEVFADGGFDAILSNPPWERVKLQEQEFFAVRDARIAIGTNKAARAKLIRELPDTNPELHQEFVDGACVARRSQRFMRHSGRFPLSGRGDINTYAVFAEVGVIDAESSRAGRARPTERNRHRRYNQVCSSGRLIDRGTPDSIDRLRESKSSFSRPWIIGSRFAR